MTRVAHNLQSLRQAYEVIVIGAGPAGMAAATLAATAGLSTLLLDENPSVGGQVYRAATTAPLKHRNILGEEFATGATLAAALVASGAEVLQGASVWSLDRDCVVGVSHAGRSRLVKAGRVILCTGALERPFPIPGWTLPGVMSAGAAQTLLKSSGLVPAGQVILAGQGPLLWLLAAQLLRAGGSIAAVLDTTSWTNRLAALPHLPGFLLSPYLRKGLGLIREVTRQVRVIRQVSSLAAEGEDRLRFVAFMAGGKPGRIAANALFLHQGVVPQVNLAMAAGIPHRWDETQLCFSPALDVAGESPVPGVFIAGDGAGIAGAEVAVLRGRLAAVAVIGALRSGRVDGLPTQTSLLAALRRQMRGRAFLDLLFRPLREFRIPQADDTVVCRCEEVTAGQIREAVKIGATGPNQLKAYRRCGMGPCQGRLCGLTVTEIMAEARGKTPDEIGHYRLRAPVKPVTLAEIASIAADETAIAAVVRD